MSSPKDIRRYPEQWLSMFEWFEAHPEEPLVIECPTLKKASSLRFEFYRARKAMQKEAELRKVFRQADRREVSIEEGPSSCRVHFRLKDQTTVASLLEQALKEND